MSFRSMPRCCLLDQRVRAVLGRARDGRSLTPMACVTACLVHSCASIAAMSTSQQYDGSSWGGAAEDESGWAGGYGEAVGGYYDEGNEDEGQQVMMLMEHQLTPAQQRSRDRQRAIQERVDERLSGHEEWFWPQQNQRIEELTPGREEGGGGPKPEGPRGERG